MDRYAGWYNQVKAGIVEMNTKCIVGKYLPAVPATLSSMTIILNVPHHYIRFTCPSDTTERIDDG